VQAALHLNGKEYKMERDQSTTNIPEDWVKAEITEIETGEGGKKFAVCFSEEFGENESITVTINKEVWEEELSPRRGMLVELKIHQTIKGLRAHKARLDRVLEIL
jgi:predicted transcriptional regulator YdeE